MTKTNKDGPLQDQSKPYYAGIGNCWAWTGWNYRVNGYGKIKIKGKAIRAHRLMWEVRHGPIPEGFLVCHRCDNKLCVNPDHLFLGTTQQNVDDMTSKGRSKVRGPREKRQNKPRKGAKLTLEIVTQIREMCRNGRGKQREAGRMFGVSRANINLIVLGKTWSWVHGFDAPLPRNRVGRKINSDERDATNQP